ncbi:MAG: hypothetical protein AAF204_04625 [Pseudomonadota bacterium]
MSNYKKTPTSAESVSKAQQDAAAMKSAEFTAGVIEIVHDLVESEVTKQSHGNSFSIKVQETLDYLFKKAAMNKSTFGTFTHAFATALGVEEYNVVQNTKERQRAGQKMSAEGRALNDVERARIFPSTVSEMEFALSLVYPGKRTSPFLSSWLEKGIEVTEVKAYPVSPRSSGYSGAIHVDVGIKNLEHEIQIMPIQYKEIDRLSHVVFEMMRYLEENFESVKAFEKEYDKTGIIPTARKEIEDPMVFIYIGLLIGNKSLWDEASRKYGYDSLRSRTPEVPEKEQASIANEVLQYIIDLTENDSRQKAQRIAQACKAAQHAALQRFAEVESILAEYAEPAAPYSDAGLDK